MRYVILALGLVTLGLAVPLAGEGLWWAAIPDGAFGAGVAWVAFVSLREDAQTPPPAPPAPPVKS